MSMVIEATAFPDEPELSDGLVAKIATLDALHAPRYFRWKSGVDRAVAAVLLLPALPLIGVLVLLIRRSSRGPGVFRQRRVGQYGRVYTMYKLRSMRQDAEAATGPIWTPGGTHHDPRLTRIGYWLRKLHLDELPQLFNVLKGEMSLVGPRPERPEFVEVLAEKIPSYLDRLSAPPGITGLAQINLPPDTNLDDVRRKLVLDKEYIQTASLLLDLRMGLCTLLRIVGVKGESAMHIMQLKRKVEIPASETTSDGKDKVSDKGTDKAIDGALLATPEQLARQKTFAASSSAIGRKAGQVRGNGHAASNSGIHSKDQSPSPGHATSASCSLDLELCDDEDDDSVLDAPYSSSRDISGSDSSRLVGKPR